MVLVRVRTHVYHLSWHNVAQPQFQLTKTHDPIPYINSTNDLDVGSYRGSFEPVSDYASRRLSFQTSDFGIDMRNLYENQT
jgi:hypothetical protein